MTCGQIPPAATATRTRRPTPSAGTRQLPRTHRVQERQRDEHGHHREQGAGGDDRVDLGVERAGDAVVLHRHQRVPLEPVAGRPQQQEGHAEQAEVDARLRRGPLPRPRQPQAAVQVVGEQRGEPGQQDDRGEEADEELQQRQAEDVEADVETELRVGGAERLAVQPQLDRLPLPGRGGAGEQAEDDGHREPHEAPQRLQLLAVAVERLLPRGGRRVDRPRAEGDGQARPHRERHDQRGHDEQPGLGEQAGPQHLDEAQLGEPEHLGPQLGEEHEQEDDPPEDRQRGGEGTGATAAPTHTDRPARAPGPVTVGGGWTRRER